MTAREARLSALLEDGAFRGRLLRRAHAFARHDWQLSGPLTPEQLMTDVLILLDHYREAHPCQHLNPHPTI